MQTCLATTPGHVTCYIPRRPHPHIPAPPCGGMAEVRANDGKHPPTGTRFLGALAHKSQRHPLAISSKQTEVGASLASRTSSHARSSPSPSHIFDHNKAVRDIIWGGHALTGLAQMVVAGWWGDWIRMPCTYTGNSVAPPLGGWGGKVVCTALRPAFVQNRLQGGEQKRREMMTAWASPLPLPRSMSCATDNSLKAIQWLKWASLLAATYMVETVYMHVYMC